VFVAIQVIISEPTRALPIWIHWCEWPNYDSCISQGSVATVLRWSGQNYSPLCQVAFFVVVACQKNY